MVSLQLHTLHVPCGLRTAGAPSLGTPGMMRNARPCGRESVQPLQITPQMRRAGYSGSMSPSQDKRKSRIRLHSLRNSVPWCSTTRGPSGGPLRVPVRRPSPPSHQHNEALPSRTSTILHTMRQPLPSRRQSHIIAPVRLIMAPSMTSAILRQTLTTPPLRLPPPSTG